MTSRRLGSHWIARTLKFFRVAKRAAPDRELPKYKDATGRSTTTSPFARAIGFSRHLRILEATMLGNWTDTGTTASSTIYVYIYIYIYIKRERERE